MLVDRHQALIQCIQNIHALQEQLTERVRLIAEQLPLDPLRKPHAEQTADTERKQRDEQIGQQHAQHRPMVGAQIQPSHDDTCCLSVFITHDGIRTAVGTVRQLVAREHRFPLAAQSADGICPQGRQHGYVSRTGGKVIKCGRLARHIIHAEHIHLGYALHRTHQILLYTVRLNVIGQQRRICRHLRRIGQQLVTRPDLLMQLNPQTDRHCKQQHNRDALHQHPAHLPVQRAGGTCICQIHPLLLRRHFIS